MPKTDLVPTYYSGSSQAGEADEVQTRETLRLWKKEGRGYFVRNGRAFQMIGPPPIPEKDWETLMRKYGVRGQSVKIDEPTDKRIGMMSRYVMGETYARAAVESWHV